MSEKLFYQFYKAIFLSLSIGTDKHSYKKSNESRVKIFSYEDRRNIIKCTNQLSKFIENNYPEISYIKEVNTKHIEEFFRYKSKFCSNNTMKNYKYCIKKLEKMVNEYLYIKVKYIPDNLKFDTKEIYLRTLKMDDKDIQIILAECRKSKSKAAVGIELGIRFGLRVSEICKVQGRDINLEKRLLHIHEAKGKRSRDIPIDNYEKLEICIRIKNLILDKERVCKLKEDSVNLVIRRILLKNKIIKYAEAKTGVHSIRKAYATKTYTNKLKNTNNEKNAWDATALELGHNKGRQALKNVYVKL